MVIDMRYEILDDEGQIINVIIADLDFVETHYPGRHREQPEDPAIVKARLAAEIRAQRDLLIAQTDWTQAPDVPQALKDKWAPYRQALRDVPQQSGFPENITWPTKPE